MTRLRGSCSSRLPRGVGLRCRRGPRWRRIRCRPSPPGPVHLASNVAHGDLDDDVLGAGSADVRGGDLERPAAAGRSACVGDGDAEIGRAAGAREPAETSTATTAIVAPSETTSSAHSNGVRSRLMPRPPEACFAVI